MKNTYQLVFTAPNGGQIEIHHDHLSLELAEQPTIKGLLLPLFISATL